jgi:hypothetical protein
MSGSVTRRKTWPGVRPDVRATSSSPGDDCSSAPDTSRNTYGYVNSPRTKAAPVTP